MLKPFFFTIACLVFISSCSEPDKPLSNQADKTNKASEQVAQGLIPKASQKPTTPIANTTVIEKITDENSTDASNKALDMNISFAKPDSKNSALFDNIISNIVADNKVINFSAPLTEEDRSATIDSCKKIDNKLASITLEECMSSNLRPSGFKSGNDFPILITEFPPLSGKKPLGKVLVIGGTHGDELTSISIVFKWITILQKYHSGLFHWHVAPLMNPDGALLKRATRPNANKVDLNRNMPTPDWYRSSSERWNKINKDPRKNPGIKPASEPETQWLIHEIETFKPDAIISVHAPYGILDFDAPDLTTAPKSFGRLRLNLLGTYPGSLGNYAGINRDIPVLTLELPHSWVMPKSYEVNEIWTDMVRWLRTQLKH